MKLSLNSRDIIFIFLKKGTNFHKCRLFLYLNNSSNKKHEA